MVQHQRHHVVVAGTLEDGTSSLPTATEKRNHQAKSSKEPERPPEGYLAAMVFHLKAGGIPDILMRKASGIMFALQVPTICSFIHQIFTDHCAGDSAKQEKSEHRVLVVKKNLQKIY